MNKHMHKMVAVEILRAKAAAKRKAEELESARQAGFRRGVDLGQMQASRRVAMELPKDFTKRVIEIFAREVAAKWAQSVSDIPSSAIVDVAKAYWENMRFYNGNGPSLGMMFDYMRDEVRIELEFPAVRVGYAEDRSMIELMRAPIKKGA